MEISTNKNQINKLLKRSITIWISGMALFFIGFWGTFNPASPSPEILFIVFVLSMPLGIVGFIMTIINLIKFLKQ